MIGTLEHPCHLAWAGMGSVASAAGIAATTVMADVPTPLEAGKWPFYGVLLFFVIVLASTIAYMVRWYVKDQLVRQERTEAVIAANTAAINHHRESLEKVNEFWDELGKDIIKERLRSADGRGGS